MGEPAKIYINLGVQAPGPFGGGTPEEVAATLDRVKAAAPGIGIIVDLDEGSGVHRDSDHVRLYPEGAGRYTLAEEQAIVDHAKALGAEICYHLNLTVFLPTDPVSEEERAAAKPVWTWTGLHHCIPKEKLLETLLPQKLDELEAAFPGKLDYVYLDRLFDGRCYDLTDEEVRYVLDLIKERGLGIKIESTKYLDTILESGVKVLVDEAVSEKNFDTGKAKVLDPKLFEKYPDLITVEVLYESIETIERALAAGVRNIAIHFGGYGVVSQLDEILDGVRAITENILALASAGSGHHHHHH
uniref:ENDO-ALPHA-N-ACETYLGALACTOSAMINIDASE n=1 Tax=synthetic construct TaxID=32630 RepID=UPI003003A6C3